MKEWNQCTRGRRRRNYLSRKMKTKQEKKWRSDSSREWETPTIMRYFRRSGSSSSRCIVMSPISIFFPFALSSTVTAAADGTWIMSTWFIDDLRKLFLIHARKMLMRRWNWYAWSDGANGECDYDGHALECNFKWNCLNSTIEWVLASTCRCVAGYIRERR